MIKLESLSVEGVRPFGVTPLAVTFHPCMNAVVGPNGSGKTTLLNCVLAALTNQFGPLGGKAECIDARTPADGTARIELGLTGPAGAMSVRRSVRPSGDLLQISDRKIRKVAQIAEEIEAQLGVSPTILTDFVFAAQGCIDTLLTATFAKRQQSLSELFGIHKLEKIASAVSSALRSDEAPASIVGMEAALDANKQTAAGILQQMIDVEMTLVGRDLAAMRTQKDQLQQRIQTLARRTAALEEKNRLALRLSGYTQQLGETTAALQKHAADKVVLDAQIQSERSEYVRLDSIISKWSLYNQAVSNRNNLISRGQAKVDELNRHAPPAQPSNDPTQAASSIAARISMLTQENRIDREFCDKWGTTGKCPVCGQEAPHVEHDAQSKRTAIAARNREVDQLNVAFRSSQAVEKAWQDYTSFRHTKQTEINTLQQELNSLPLLPESPIEMDLETATNLRSQVEARGRVTGGQLRDIEGRIVSLRQQVAALESTQKLDNQTMARVEAELSSCAEVVGGASEESLSRLTMQIEDTVAALERKSSCTQRLKELGDEATRLKSDIAAMSERWKRRDALMLVQRILERDALPQAVIGMMLSSVVARANEALVDFGDPLRLFLKSVEGTMDPWARRADGIEHDVAQLSGGWRVVTALCLRIAINSLYASQAGLLVIDEPTVFLDDTNTDRLRGVFESLRSLARLTGLQVIVVTHERSILGAFDHVIELGRQM